MDLTLVEYLQLPEASRVSYLEQHVNDSTDLSALFCEEALVRELAPVARWYLIRAIGLLRSTSALPILIEMCRRPNADWGHTSLHAITAWSFGRIGAVALPPLLDALVGTEDIAMKRCIADAFGEMRAVECIPVLYRLFREEPYEVKLWAALSLAKTGEAARDVLYRLMEEVETWQERVLLIDAIAKLDKKGAFGLMKKVLCDGSDEERRFVLETYGKTFDESFREPLKRLVETRREPSATLASRLLDGLRPLVSGGG